ncbi:MAG: NAD(P)-binding domain-containing protein [Acidimicrobiales bacterium]|nr:NAD(P)-binding domain-containing protein [Acidimicrobiales bacterium]
MRIAVIGAGRVGATLGRRARSAGHDVVYGVRDPAEPRHEALGAVATVDRAVVGADVVVVALPWDAASTVLPGLDVGHAVVIDATNPLAAGARDLDRHPELSGAELVARWTGSGRVVKAFNTTGSGNLADPAYPGGTPVMLVTGDDAEAKQVAMALAEQLGFDPVDAGPLGASSDLEHLATIWIRLAYSLAHGPDIAFALLRR